MEWRGGEGEGEIDEAVQEVRNLRRYRGPGYLRLSGFSVGKSEGRSGRRPDSGGGNPGRTEELLRELDQAARGD